MKSMLFLALMVFSIAACDSPKPTTTGSDTTANRSATDTTTSKPDSTRQQ